MTQSNNQRKMQENFKQYWNPLKFKVLGKHIENQMYIQDQVYHNSAPHIWFKSLYIPVDMKGLHILLRSLIFFLTWL